MKSWAKIKKSEWQEFAEKWRTFRLPWKPSLERNRIYNRLIKKYVSGEQALILGATPEIRDLLAKYKYTVALTDFNPQAVKEMDLLLEYQEKRREKLVVIDWLKMKFSPNSFDFVLADWSFNNLPTFSKYEVLCRKIQKILKPEGLFINRLSVFSSKIRQKSVKEIMKNYHKKPREKYSFLQELQDYSEISSRNKKTFQVELGRHYNKEIPRAYRQGKMTRQEYQRFCLDFKVSPKFKLLLTIPDKLKLEKLFKKYFKIINVKYGRDYLYSRHEPIYILKPKK